MKGVLIYYRTPDAELEGEDLFRAIVSLLGEAAPDCMFGVTVESEAELQEFAGAIATENEELITQVPVAGSRSPETDIVH